MLISMGKGAVMKYAPIIARLHIIHDFDIPILPID